MNTSAHQFEIFISYHKDDEDWVQDFLLDPLNAAGVQYATEHNFRGGVPRLQEFERVIKLSGRTLLVLSPAYLTDEFNSYTEMLVRHYGVETGTWRVIPLILQPVELPLGLQSLVALDARDPERWPEVLERLFEQLDADIPTFNTPAEGRSPYMGLRYYDVKDSPWFYGRKGVTQKLLRHISRSNFLAVVGASGSGKSSVVRAGLVYALQPRDHGEDEMPVPEGSRDWLKPIITPGANPLNSLASGLIQETGSEITVPSLVDDFTKNPQSLDTFIQDFCIDKSVNGFLLVIDQFEEIFTLCQDIVHREVFINNLMNAVLPDRPLRVVITLRADFYHRCMDYQTLREALEVNQINLGPITRAGLRRVIEEPAVKGGWSFEPGLVEQLLRDVGAVGDRNPEPGALPLLSHALLETWKRRRGTQMTFAGYHEAGTVKTALARTADRIYTGLDAADQRIARKIFVQLTELNENAQDTRRRAELDELMLENTRREEIEDVLDTLANARLITTDFVVAEVAHDALIREWGLLRDWLDDDRDSLRIQRHILKTAESWKERGYDPGELYSGGRLIQAVEWAENNYGKMSQLEKDFLTASQDKAAKEKRARQLRWIGLIAPLVVAFVIAVFAATGKLNRFIFWPVDLDDYWVAIPAGEFLMGSANSDPLADEDEFPQSVVYLDAYRMGRYEVTNRQWEQCERAGICSPKYAGPEKALQPVVNLNWYEAQAFCEWVGGRLPTEAEWEKAARSSDGRIYPWGDIQPNRELTSYNGALSMAPVGSYPKGASPYGLMDMAGNAWEWVADWYQKDYYDVGLGEGVNPKGPSSGEKRVLRGGSLHSGEHEIRAADRQFADPTNTLNLFGFRCAADIP